MRPFSESMTWERQQAGGQLLSRSSVTLKEYQTISAASRRADVCGGPPQAGPEPGAFTVIILFQPHNSIVLRHQQICKAILSYIIDANC